MKKLKTSAVLFFETDKINGNKKTIANTIFIKVRIIKKLKMFSLP